MKLSAQVGDGMENDFERLQRSTVRFALPGVFAAVLLLGSLAGRVQDYAWPIATALVLMALIALVWLVSRWSFGLASGLLSAGIFVALGMAIQQGGESAALGLLFIPVGLATVCFGGLVGAGLALTCTLLLWLAPGWLGGLDPAQRLVGAIAAWAGAGLAWLALRPLLEVVDWSWAAFRRSSELLEQSRDFQVRLQQALEDLTAANTQLNRLNTLANNLRLVAEEERRTKEQFVANVSHELRTPLNMVIGFCEMILKSPDAYGQKLPSNLLADLQVVLRNSQHLSSLINDVLDLSQIEAGQMALVKEWVEVGEIVAAAQEAVRPLFESKHLYLRCEVAPNLPPVYCDRTRIREVLLNLLSNAGRFTSTGGVQVRVELEGQGVVFGVADTGPGISEEDSQKLFRPFQQLDGSIRRKHGGTGLGLSISKSFVEMHDGKMWVESQKQVGTTFFFRLPVEPPPMTQGRFARWVNPYIHFQKRTRHPALPQVDRRPRALVVEQGGILQRLLRRHLAGMEVVAVRDLEEARVEMEHTPAQVLVVNRPPGQGGLEDPGLIAALLYDTPAVLCSVADPVSYAPAPGIPEMLVKPISQDDFLRALDKLGRPVESILVVEDDPDAQKLFVRMLTSSGRGYRVARAENGIQALNLLARHAFDVIFLDLVMPEMDGYQFLKMREQDAQIAAIPVILISAQDPRGHPIVSSYIAATRSGGISVQQLLDGIQVLAAILSPGAAEIKVEDAGEEANPQPPP